MKNLSKKYNGGLRGWGNKVLGKNILTGEITTYSNTEVLSEVIGKPRSVVRRYLDGDRAGTLTHQWCVFKYDDGEPWPTLHAYHHFENTWVTTRGQRVSVVSKDLAAGTLAFHATIMDAAETLDLSYDMIRRSLSLSGNHKYGGHLFIPLAQ